MSLSRNIVTAIFDIAPHITTFIPFLEQNSTFSNKVMSLTLKEKRCPSPCTIKRQQDASNIGDTIPFQSVIAIVSMHCSQAISMPISKSPIQQEYSQFPSFSRHLHLCNDAISAIINCILAMRLHISYFETIKSGMHLAHHLIHT